MRLSSVRGIGGLGLGVCVALLACGAFETATVIPGDAGSDVQDGTLVDAQDAGVAGVIFTDGFEDTITCPGWTTNGEKSRETGTRRSGNTACRVCVVAAGNSTFLTRDVDGGGSGGYELQAWASGSLATGDVATKLYLHTSDGGQVADLSSGAATATDAFKQLTIAGRTNAPITRATIELLVSGEAGECIVWDDVSLLRVP